MELTNTRTDATSKRDEKDWGIPVTRGQPPGEEQRKGRQQDGEEPNAKTPADARRDAILDSERVELPNEVR